MTEAEHNRPITKLFDNRPSASTAEVLCETIRPIVLQKNQVIYTHNIPIIVSFSLLLSQNKPGLILSPKVPAPRGLKININSNFHMVL